MNNRMETNFFQPNKDKNEVLVVGAKAQRQPVCQYLESWNPGKQVNIMDGELRFSSPINCITKTAHFHPGNNSKITGFLPSLNQKDSCLLLSYAG